MLKADVAVIGAGAAGLSLAHRLSGHPADLPGMPGVRAVPGALTPSVILIDAPPGPLRPGPRTWCFWESGRGRFDAAVRSQWRHLRVRPPTGPAVEADITPLRYKMIRSDDFESLVSRDLAHSPNVRRLEAAVDTVEEIPAGTGARVLMTPPGGPAAELEARWVFDSRPLGSLPAARTTLLQHFHGWFVRTAHPAFDPGSAELMDFRTPQPASGLSFGYVLPTSPHEALLEYTEFSPRVLTASGYEAALRHYAEDVLSLPLGDVQIVAAETGVIPMTDAPMPRRVGTSVFRIGAAGGATRPSTGYTFAGLQRQTRSVAAALRQGRRPVPPAAHSVRARAMDSVLLRALDSGRVDGPELFCRLFTRVPAARLLRFLDGRTNLLEDLAVGRHAPVGPMLRTALELPGLPRRAFT
ncbi:lycopene cyclase family protein [Streptomyces sp. NPDC060232]|uniref:lycopene cyclase family protein n=1 Tax=Streptomyces sp. NPDC060232 TaxID=3347079 RepID=UPI003657D7C4